MQTSTEEGCDTLIYPFCMNGKVKENKKEVKDWKFLFYIPLI